MSSNKKMDSFNGTLKRTCDFSSFHILIKIYLACRVKIGLKKYLKVNFKHTCYLFLLNHPKNAIIILHTTIVEKSLYVDHLQVGCITTIHYTFQGQ